METTLAILGIGIALLGFIASYHIAAAQGVFRKEKILLTISQPTLSKTGHPPSRYGKVFRVHNLALPDSTYPFLLKMPLLVTFGIRNNKRPCVVFLLISILNKKPTAEPDVSVSLYLPAKMMPDRKIEFGTPEGMITRRSINDTAGEGHVKYAIGLLKPFDYRIIAEPLFIELADVLSDSEQHEGGIIYPTQLDSLRFVLQTRQGIREERLWLAVIPSDNLETIVRSSATIASGLLREHPGEVHKPFIRRVLGFPYASRSVLCVRPEFFYPSDKLAVHRFGQACDQSESKILGKVL